MNYFKLKEIFDSEQNAVEYLIKVGIVCERKCWRCKNLMKIDVKRKVRRCPKKIANLQEQYLKTVFLVDRKSQLTVYYG